MIQNAFRCTHPSQTPWRSPIGMCCTKELYTSMPLDQKWAKQNIRKSADRSVFGDCRRFRDYCEHAGGRPIRSHSGLNIRIGLGEGGGHNSKNQSPEGTVLANVYRPVLILVEPCCKQELLCHLRHVLVYPTSGRPRNKTLPRRVNSASGHQMM